MGHPLAFDMPLQKKMPLLASFFSNPEKAEKTRTDAPLPQENNILMQSLHKAYYSTLALSLSTA